MTARNTAGRNQAGKSRSAMNAKQVDASVQTNFEFAQDLGATGYNEAGTTAAQAGRASAQTSAAQRASASQRGKYSR